MPKPLSIVIRVAFVVSVALRSRERHDAVMKSRKLYSTPKRRNAELTRAKILQAALREFSERGLRAASTDAIAARCNVNKRMIYYYYESKEGLYLAALEWVLENLVAREKEINIEHLDPPAAIEAMINLKIDYYLENPYFMSFLAMENFHQARYLRTSKKLARFKTPLTEVITRILKRGQMSGDFRHDVDPIDFYISMCSLCMMYFSNQHTFGAIFERDMMSQVNIAKRRQTVIDFVLSYLRSPQAIRQQATRLAAPRRNSRGSVSLVT